MSANVIHLESDVVLRASRVGKLYARRQSAMRRRLGMAAGKALLGLGRSDIGEVRRHEFWAVKDVSFELNRGEALGLIGLNGSGKTTTLRMLAGQLLPDAGEIWINGSSAAMIDLTAGFQSSSSGRENILLRAAALGFRREETLQRMDEIIAFSELGDAIHAPLATYSSGMRMRLAFSIMAMVAPDVLFIDEVLAVGDFRFRQKCLGKIREMRERSAFVFVSHSMGDVARFCDRVIVMHKGVVCYEGAPDDAIAFYESLEPTTPSREAPSNLRRQMGPEFTNNKALEDVDHYWCDTNGNVTEAVRFDEPLRLRVRFRSNVKIRSLIIGIPIWNINGQYTTGLSTQITSDRFDVDIGEEVNLLLEVDGGYMNPGVLKSMLTILDGAEFFYRKPNPDLSVLSPSHPTWGAVTLPHRWTRLDVTAQMNVAKSKAR